MIIFKTKRKSEKVSRSIECPFIFCDTELVILINAILPAFSAAIFSIVSPKIFTWSSCIDVIMDSVGVMIFVESSLPPSPTSTTIASQLARLNAANARVLVSSKKVAGIEYLSQRSKSSGSIFC